MVFSTWEVLKYVWFSFGLTLELCLCKKQTINAEVSEHILIRNSMVNWFSKIIRMYKHRQWGAVFEL